VSGVLAYAHWRCENAAMPNGEQAEAQQSLTFDQQENGWIATSFAQELPCKMEQLLNTSVRAQRDGGR
jgi:hypothetical protein